MNKKIIKIDRIKWAEAGIRKGYISFDESNYIDFRKEAMLPLVPLLAAGAVFYTAGEGIGALMDYATGGKSWQEMMRGGYNATTESVQQFETGLIALEEEVKPLLQGSTLNIQEAVQDAIDQGHTTLKQMNEELINKGMAPSRVNEKRQQEAAKKKKIEENNLIILYNAALKPVTGSRPGSPETKKLETSLEELSKKSGEAGRQISESVQAINKNPEILTEAAAGSAPSASGASKGQPGASHGSGKKLNPRIFGGV